MINAVAMKCPSCNADLEVDPSRKECFCSYCGAKIILTNDNEKTFTVNINKVIESTHREINEAEILRAENERLKMEKEELAQKESAATKKKFLSTGFRIGIILSAIGWSLRAILNENSNGTLKSVMVMTALIGAMFILFSLGMKIQETFPDDQNKKHK